MSAELLEPLETGLTARLARRLAGRVQAADLPWAAQVISWMDLADLCRELDDSLVAANDCSEKVVALHGAVLELAIGCGSSLLHQIHTNGVDISASGQTVEVLAASLEMLRIFHRSRHPDAPDAEIAAVRQRVFNAAA